MKKKTSSTIPALTGLRGFAILLVVFSHAGMHGMIKNLPGMGQLGLMLFFALSGYLITQRYFATDSLRGWLIYARNRVLRIFPAYLFVLFACWFLSSRYNVPVVFPIDEVELLKHIFLLGEYSPLKTIPIEMKFYALFPVIALVVRELSTRATIRALLLFCAWLASTLIPFRLETVIDLMPHLSMFLSGMWFGYMAQQSHPRTNTGPLAAVCLLCIVIAIPNLFAAIFGFAHGLWHDSLAFSLLMGLTVFASAHAQGRVGQLLSHPFLVHIGKISFSLFLIHWMAYAVVERYIHGPGWAVMGTGIILAMWVATAMYYLIERPAYRLFT